MDYNSIDEDDIENLRLAALMTLKKKPYFPKNTEGSLSRKCQHGSSYNNYSRNNEGQLPPTSNKSYSKCEVKGVCFQRLIHPNNNSIECDSQTNLTTLAFTNIKCISELTPNDKLSDTQYLKNKVSPNLSRIKHKSDSEKSEDSESERIQREELDNGKDNGDVLLLGEKYEDDLEKLMEIMEYEIANGYGESSIKDKNSTAWNATTSELILINSPKIDSSKSQLNTLKEEIESTKTLKPNINSQSQCTLLKSSIILRSPLPPNKKRSHSPDSPCDKPQQICSVSRSSTQVRHRYSSKGSSLRYRSKSLSPQYL